MPPYRLGRYFAVRLAGVPFDILHTLSTGECARAARECLSCDAKLDQASHEAKAALKGATQLSPNERSGMIKKLFSRRPIDARPDGAADALNAYAGSLAAYTQAVAALDAALVSETQAARMATWRNSIELLPDFAVFESESLAKELERQRTTGPSALERRHVRHMALYLQRVAAKNDSITRFGPVGWGEITRDVVGMELDAKPGIWRRRGVLERWVARALAIAVTHDQAARLEMSPRRMPEGALAGNVFVRHDTGEETVLDPAQLALVERCDGRTRAKDLGATDVLQACVDRGVLIWELEVAVADPDPVRTLQTDIDAWSECEARTRWLAIAKELTGIAQGFETQLDPVIRRKDMERVRARVAEIGQAVPERTRAQYQGANPINENCARDCGLRIGERDVDRVMTDAAPFFDLYQDAFCLAASHAFSIFRGLYTSAPRPQGRLSLSSFIAHAERQGVSLESWALPRIGEEAFARAQAELSSTIASRGSQAELTLTREECHLIRRNHKFVRFPEFSLPSVDLQIAAASAEQMKSGDYDWVVAELHSYAFPIQWTFSWVYPDEESFRQTMARATADRPVLMHNHRLLDATVQLTFWPRFKYLPKLSLVSRERPPPGFRAVNPADTELVMIEDQEDIRVREVGSGRDLGSVVRSDYLFNAINPFVPFTLPGHTPRLRLGRSIVQRRTWEIERSALGGEHKNGATREFVLAVEKLRASRDLPRWVFIKPGVLGATNALARDKDRKPLYIDLESYPFLDVLARWFEKYEVLNITEMLPDPTQIPWREADGLRTFELRCSVLANDEEKR